MPPLPKDFERHIHARLNGYHREDPKAKEQDKETCQQACKATKQEKRQRYILSWEARLKAFKRIARKNWRRLLIQRVTAFLRLY